MSDRIKKLIQYVVPSILSSVCIFLFTIIDGIFVGNGVGTNGLGAVNIVFPYVMVVSALFMLTSVGGVTIVAIRLGRGDSEGANQAFMHAMLSSTVVTSVLSAAGVCFTGPICRLLGANGTFYELTKDYLFWYSLFIVPSGLSMALQGFCRNDGSPILVSAAVIISTACNIFGDWLLIFPMRMGLKGAAIATGVSQSITLFIVLIHFARKKGNLRFGKFYLQPSLFRKMAVRGLPESISQLSTPVSTICMNYVLLANMGDIGVNTFSIIAYVASFSVAIFFGAAGGLQPLFGQCYGAKKKDDLQFFFKAGMLIDFFGSMLINILLLFIGGSICAMFGADEETLAFTVSSMPLYAWGFVVMALNTMISAYLYSTKRSRQAIIMNLLRSLAVNALVTLAFPVLFGKDIIWHTFGIYEGIVLVAAMAMLIRSERKLEL